MPITKSAKKEMRGSTRRKVFNDRRRTVMKEMVKKVRKLVETGQVDQAKELIPKTYKAIDKSAKKGVIKANTADRKKSRLAKLVSKNS
ncbi:MAG: 30S ribosomal protein S20 [Patescibacteria group bacterium]